MVPYPTPDAGIGCVEYVDAQAELDRFEEIVADRNIALEELREGCSTVPRGTPLIPIIVVSRRDFTIIATNYEGYVSVALDPQTGEAFFIVLVERQSPLIASPGP